MRSLSAGLIFLLAMIHLIAMHCQGMVGDAAAAAVIYF